MRFIIAIAALSMMFTVGCAKKTEASKSPAPLDVTTPAPVVTDAPITPIPAPAPAPVVAPTPAPAVAVAPEKAPEKAHSTAHHSGGKTTYTVKKGDTLTKISRAHYGDTSHIKQILAANPKLKNANDIKPGQKIVLP